MGIPSLPSSSLDGNYLKMNDCYQLGVLNGSQPRYLKLKSVGIARNVFRSLLIGLLNFEIKMIRL